MTLNINDNLKKSIQDQGLKVEEIQSIIENSISTSKRLFSNDRNLFLSKEESKNLTIYVEYSANEILDVYTHKMNIIGITGKIIEPVGYDDTTEWKCEKCNENAVYRNIDMEYFGVIRAGPGIICPKCLESYVSSGVAKTIKKAEDTLEEKRG